MKKHGNALLIIGLFLILNLYLIFIRRTGSNPDLYGGLNGLYAMMTEHTRWLLQEYSFAWTGLIVFCMLFGVLATVILYQLMLWIRIKESKYFFSLLFFLFLLIHQTIASGFISFINIKADKYLYENIDVLMNFLMLSFISFACSFLSTSVKTPGYHKILRVFQFMHFINILLWVTSAGMNWSISVNTYLLLITEWTIISRVSILAKRDKAAKIFFIAIMVLLAGFVSEIFCKEVSVHALLIASAVASILIAYSFMEQLFFIHDKNVQFEQVEKSLTELSLTDELSQLYNRRFFNEKIKYEVERAHRENKPLSLLLLDIDHFKDYNDAYGHPEGDKAIMKIGKIIKRNIRDTDYACRVGGEEFAIILTGTNKYAAEKHVAERLHSSLSRQVFMIMRNRKVLLTVSIGIGQLQKEENADSLIGHTDKAMYKAKELGRNRTVLYDENLK